jgi:serine/arginine repetitive matrix protein 1
MSRPMRGTTYDQDPRYKDKESKLLNSRQWPLEYEIQVNIQNINMEIVKTWVSKQITEILGVEDDILNGLIISSLEEPQPCAKKIHILIGEFLQNNTQKFVIRLWRFLTSAQDTSLGVPQQFISERREELLRKKRELERLIDWVNSLAKKSRKRSRSNEGRKR